MTLRKRSGLLAFACAALFSLLYLAGLLEPAEDSVYDFFLRFRPVRERAGNVLFLDVDDLAIADIGVFPWPRSVMAGGLLRLKEYGAALAVFDIEYIDRSPAGVDEVYMNQGLSSDFQRVFSEISSGVSGFTGSVLSGRGKGREAEDSRRLVESIEKRRDYLLGKAQDIAVDNDEYLARAARLFGHAWATLNIQIHDLEGEQAGRRVRAEERFSYPVAAAPDARAFPGADILPPILSFMEAARGAGYTNVIIDGDGVRRRIFLVRPVRDHWYLQLAFAPLVEYLGNPEITLEAGRLTLKNARLSEGGQGDIVIPLDSRGAMMLDWPRETYFDSFSHLSFAIFSYLERSEAGISQYLSAMAGLDDNLFGRTVHTANRLTELFDAAAEQRKAALEEAAGSFFQNYIAVRDEARQGIQEFLDSGAAREEIERVREYYESHSQQGEIAWFLEEADYAETLLEYLKTEYENLKNYDAILRENLPGKFCILGRSDTGTTDIGVNPFHGEYVNVGTHAVVLDTILSRSFIKPLSGGFSILAALLLVPLLILALSGLSPVARSLLGLASAFAVMGASLLLFRFTGVFLGPLGAALGMVSAAIIREIMAFVSSEKEKSFLRSAFSRYLSPKVIEQIIADPSQLKLGGEKRTMTAIFTDVRSFSTITEALGDPEKLVELLNHYLTRMSNIILENGGTIDKYEGDAIIAFFGAPLRMENHAELACRSVIKMRKAEAELNRDMLAQGLITEAVVDALLKKDIIKDRRDPPLFTRLGVNTGEMVVGNMGTPNKMDYTIMGNAVNLAARLEGVNKQYATGILASGETLKAAGGNFLARRLDLVRVVGINNPVQLYELINLKNEATEKEVKLLRLFHAALDIYEAKDWIAAEAAFAKALDFSPKDGPSRLYRERCAKYRASPPAPDWDGVVSLDQK